ncbi:MAG: deoxyribonuclease IV [Omnitrophica bacterium]|nr:deoxyribonuclease IV [Candidatus Omnitrophota bacterium]
MLKLGVHVSIAGKIYKSIDRTAELGCNTMQIFSRNPRQWRRSFLGEEDVRLFRKKTKKAKIAPVIIHIPYTLNLASVKHSFFKITVKEFITDLIESDKLGAGYLVTHMGSYKGSTEQGGLLRVVNALNKIIKATKGVNTQILLENTSGSGHWLGANFSHQKFVFQRLNHPNRIGICLDTAHAWAAGYKINDSKGLGGLLDEIENEVGLERIKAIHLNDTQEELGSLRDRHFAIGEGKIGKRGFSLIINHPKLKDLPFILETPKKEKDADEKNLETIRKLYKNDLQ